MDIGEKKTKRAPRACARVDLKIFTRYIPWEEAHEKSLPLQPIKDTSCYSAERERERYASFRVSADLSNQKNNNNELVDGVDTSMLDSRERKPLPPNELLRLVFYSS